MPVVLLRTGNGNQAEVVPPPAPVSSFPRMPSLVPNKK